MWWQQTSERELLELMQGNPSIKRAKTDHKNKTLAQKCFEPMSEYFSKHGMSNLGTYLSWWGRREGKEGWFVWFIDMVMENTTSQEAADVIPGVEALVEELENAEFVVIAGKTEELWLATDNALTSTELSVFISLLNMKKLGSVQIRRWENPEAQTFKNQIDTHFMYMNLWLEKSVLSGMVLACPRTMFKCLTFNEGMKGNTVILLRQLPTARILFKLCRSILSAKDKQGINSVHSQLFNPDKVTLRYFTNLETGKKTLASQQFKPVLEKFKEETGEEFDDANTRTGEVLQRHQSNKGVLFVPFATDATKDNEVPSMMTLAGRIYPALKKYSSGMQFDFSIQTRTTRRKVGQSRMELIRCYNSWNI